MGCFLKDFNSNCFTSKAFGFVPIFTLSKALKVIYIYFFIIPFLHGNHNMAEAFLVGLNIYVHFSFFCFLANTFSQIEFLKQLSKFQIFNHYNLQINFSKILISKFNF